MALPLPHLDDRRWADLVDEGRALIPRHAPAWTDHNVHDPGVTVIELFAWLAEQGIYRLNQVPDRHRRKFLRLLGFETLPPRPAHAALAVHLQPAIDPFVLPAGALLEAVREEDAPPTVFRTRRAVSVGVTTLAAILVDEGDGVLRDATADHLDGRGIEAFGNGATVGASLYLGFAAIPLASPVSLVVKVAGPPSGRAERERLLAEDALRRSQCRPPASTEGCPDAPPIPAEPEPWLRHHSARLEFAVATAGGWQPLHATEDEAAPAAGEVRDDTRAFSLDGVLDLSLPGSAVPTVLSPATAPLFYVRARLDAGGWDAPPVLSAILVNGVVAEQVEPLAQSYPIAAGVVPAPPPLEDTTVGLRLTVDAAGVIGALEVEASLVEAAPIRVFRYLPAGPDPGRIDLDVVLLGHGTGRPEQDLSLPKAPVLRDRLRVYTHDGTTWDEWTLRDDFDASRRADRHVVLAPRAGRVRCGDGERGRVFPQGLPIFAQGLASRGAAGTVAADTSFRAAAQVANGSWLQQLTAEATSALPLMMTLAFADAGADEETIGSAGRRAAETLHAHERLVELAEAAGTATLDQIPRRDVAARQAPGRATNLLDYERLAMDVPGTRVARARAWAGWHPALPCLTASGVVTVVVVPDTETAQPQPTAGLLRAIARFLDRRRLVGSRVEVIGPTYLEVTVRARVKRQPLVDARRLAHDIRSALDRFFDPRLGGPAGVGWPFGRDVFASEVLQVIDDADGVEHVIEMTLAAAGQPPQCGNLGLCPSWLLASGPHEIEVE